MPISIKWGAAKDKAGNPTEECAKYTNAELLKQGIESYGNAYHILNQFRPTYNGYPKTLPNFEGDKTAADSTQTILNYHREASDNVKSNFDKSKLDPDQTYVVNMYYNASPHILDFYKDAVKDKTGTYGTHVGHLYYDKNLSDWVVEHNIHGNIYKDKFDSVLGGLSNPNKYGITAISTTKPKVKTLLRNLKNNIADFLNIHQDD